MPRNPAGSTAVRDLITHLAQRNVSATPRQIEDAWRAGLAPRISRAGPVAPEVVDAYAGLVPLLGVGRSRRDAVLICFTRGSFAGEQAVVRRALAEEWQAFDSFGKSGEPPDTDAERDRASRIAAQKLTTLSRSRHPGLDWIGRVLRMTGSSGPEEPSLAEELAEVMTWAAQGHPVRDPTLLLDASQPPVLRAALQRVTRGNSTGDQLIAQVWNEVPSIRLPTPFELAREIRTVSLRRLHASAQEVRNGLWLLGPIMGTTRWRQLANDREWQDKQAPVLAVAFHAISRVNLRRVGRLMAASEVIARNRLTELEREVFAAAYSGDLAALAQLAGPAVDTVSTAEQSDVLPEGEDDNDA